MDKMVYKEKIGRWMNFAKINKIRKSEAWPFWFEFARMFGMDLPPLHFWRPINIYLYFFFAAIVPWLALVQYFTGDFVMSKGMVQWNNLGISFMVCVPIALLLGWNINNKKKKLMLGEWAHF